VTSGVIDRAGENLAIENRSHPAGRAGYKAIMADPYPIRPITGEEHAGFRRVHEHAFNGGPLPEARVARGLRQFEADRSLAALDPALPDGEAVVGTTGVYSLRMAVPGAVLPVAGVTAVSVLPTHRRRGVLRSLMHRQLADIAARGDEPVAALWAAETPIYGRYGYGRASSSGYLEFHRGEGALDRQAPANPRLTLRLADPAEAAAELAKVHDAVLAGQPGFFARDDDWWGRVLDDEPGERHGAGPLRCLLAEDGSEVRGYALYATRARWDDATGLPDGQLVVRELVAADPAAGAALWQNLLDRDLITSVTAELRPADDPVLHQLLDQRRARERLADGLWVRIIDLPAALSGRAYSGPVDVVLEVTDPLLPGNAGRWRLRAGGPGSAESGRARCERTGEPADLALDIRELGAAYLGGTRLGTLGQAGLVRELRPGTLLPLSAALTWDPAPWCPRIF
jgi:predicted acetyltransferase